MLRVGRTTTMMDDNVKTTPTTTIVMNTTTVQLSPPARRRFVRRAYTYTTNSNATATRGACVAVVLLALQQTMMMTTNILPSNAVPIGVGNVIEAFNVVSRTRRIRPNTRTTPAVPMLRHQQVQPRLLNIQHRQTSNRDYCSSCLFSTASSSTSLSSVETSQTQERLNITDYSEIWSLSPDDDDSDVIASNEDDFENEEDDDVDVDSDYNDKDDADDDADEDEDLYPWKEMYDQWRCAVDDALTLLNKKQTSLESERAKAQDVEATVKRAQLLVSNLYLFTPGTTSATVVDWEQGDGAGVEVTLTLNTKKYDSASAEADALFAQARKLKRGSQVIAQLLDETRTAIEIIQSSQQDLESVIVSSDDESSSSPMSFDEGRFALVKDRLIRTAANTNFQIPSESSSVSSSRKQQRRSKINNQGGGGGGGRRERKPEIGTPASNIRKLMSPGGCTVLVGRNRRGNEHLSLTIARGNDIWMHSRGCPGAHVVIMNRRGGPKVTEECLQFAADLAIFYSDFRNENRAEVTAVEPKHILKPRGAPLGAVKIREEWKTLAGRPDFVPDDLKEARDQSGTMDEYHLHDKAIHRRRTREAAEEDRRQSRLKRKRDRKKTA